MTTKTMRRRACCALGGLLLAAAPAAGAAPTPRQTINALRFNTTAAQLDRIYRGLPAGPMPQATSRGFVRFEVFHGNPVSGNQRGNMLLNDPFTPWFWSGQVWFVNREGEHELTQRTGPDRSGRPFPAYVHYGPSLVDGRTAMIADYPGNENPPPISNIVLDCRTVQTGVLMCYAWLYAIKPYFGPKTLLFYVFQDFTNPN
jgi:hypothetical protein